MASKVDGIVKDILSHSGGAPSTVKVCDQYLKDEGCRQLCEALTNHNTVHTLDLKGNDIQQLGAQSLADLIQRNTSITTLKLEWNQLGQEMALSALCDGLSRSRVQRLDLRNNKIGGSGGRILSEMLRGNASLCHLDLRWNNLGLVGGECILDHLTRCKVDGNYTLSECLLSGNQIPVQILRSIDGILCEHKQRALQQQHDREKEEMVTTKRESASSEQVTSTEAEIAVDPLSESSVADKVKVEVDSGPSGQIVESLVTDNRVSDEMLQSQNDSIEALQSEINDLFVTKSALCDENEAIKIKMAELESQLLDLGDKHDILQSEKRRIEREAADSATTFDSERTAAADRSKNLEEKLEDSLRSREADKSEFDRLRAAMDHDFKMELLELRQSKDAELSASRQKISDLHLEINELKTANNSLRSAVLENEMESERKCIAFEQRLRTECNETLSAKMTDLERNIAAIKASRDELEAEMGSEKEKNSKIVEQVEAEKSQFQQWLKAEQVAKSQLETENRSISRNVQKYGNVITQKNQQIESLKIGLKETQKAIKSLENEHQTSMQRVLAQHNRQILTLEKSLRETEQRLTISEHRKRNLELRIVRIEDEEHRKSAAVHDAVKTLSNVFVINSSLLKSTRPQTPSFSERECKDKERDRGGITKSSRSQKIKIEDDDEDNETIIEIIDDDDEEEDFMRDHNTFNHRKKKRNKKKSAKKKPAKN